MHSPAQLCTGNKNSSKRNENETVKQNMNKKPHKPLTSGGASVGVADDDTGNASGDERWGRGGLPWVEGWGDTGCGCGYHVTLRYAATRVIRVHPHCAAWRQVGIAGTPVADIFFFFNSTISCLQLEEIKTISGKQRLHS